MPRDDFTAQTARILAERAGYLCVNPSCRRLTVGPHSQPNKSIKTGRACHIHAAAPGGPRYLETQTSDERSSIENALWLCAVCSDKIDKDWFAHEASVLFKWRCNHEAWVSGNPSIPSLLDVSITGSYGITVSSDIAITVTAELCERLRQFEIRITNPNRVVLFDVGVRFQFPELILGITRISHSPSVHARFEPERFDSHSVATGSGSVTMSGVTPASSNWILEVDQFSPSSYLSIQMISEHDAQDIQSHFLSEFNGPDVLEYYGQGVFSFDFRGEQITRELIVPIQFDKVTRIISSLDVQSDFPPFKPIQKFRMI